MCLALAWANGPGTDDAAPRIQSDGDRTWRRATSSAATRYRSCRRDTARRTSGRATARTAGATSRAPAGSPTTSVSAMRAGRPPTWISPRRGTGLGDSNLDRRHRRIGNRRAPLRGPRRHSREAERHPAGQDHGDPGRNDAQTVAAGPTAGKIYRRSVGTTNGTAADCAVGAASDGARIPARHSDEDAAMKAIGRRMGDRGGLHSRVERPGEPTARKPRDGLHAVMPAGATSRRDHDLLCRPRPGRPLPRHRSRPAHAAPALQ